jgi:flavodoxin I
MKTLVIYDSAYGNTEKIARAIGGAIVGEVKIQRAGEVNLSELKAYDLVIIGAPTQGGRPTKPLQDFLAGVPANAFQGIKFASFDTRLSKKWVGIFGYAAGKIAETLKTNGGNMIGNPEGFFVKGREGPLADGEIERAAAWAKEIAKAA